MILQTSLNKRDYFFLFIIALVVAMVIVVIEPVPGYMDAAYYYAGGKQLASGHGFNDPFLWNYLDHPQSVPHPSNSYWYPLASIIAAGGMLITGRIDFLSARIGFIIMAVFAPVIIAALAYQITHQRLSALVSGFLAIFSCYYLPFIVTTDNYGLYMLLGGLYFLLVNRLTLPKGDFIGGAGGSYQSGARRRVALVAPDNYCGDCSGVPASSRRFLKKADSSSGNKRTACFPGISAGYGAMVCPKPVRVWIDNASRGRVRALDDGV